MKKILVTVTVMSVFSIAALITTSCNQGWSASDRSSFIKTCADKATEGMGADKAKAYCSCMEQKLEAKYSTPAEANKLTSDDFQKPDMQAMIQGCLNGGNANTNTNNNNGLVNGVTNNGNTNNQGGGGWSQDDEDKWMKACATDPNDKAICQCVLQKLEKKYVSYDDAIKRSPYDEGKQLAQECKDELGGNVGNNNTGTGWTREQHQEFVQECSTTAQQQQGMTAQQANTYCDCMTTKLEQKYTYEEASHLTAQDFQTPEWQNAVIDCRTKAANQQ